MNQLCLKHYFHPLMEGRTSIKVVCDAHNWMAGWWVSMDQPYYAVTDEGGNFKITDLPPGDYDVDVWHEVLGKKTEKVTIKPMEETKVSWELSK